MKMFTSSAMPSQQEELQLVEPKASTLPKTLSNKELEDLLEAIDLQFLFTYNEYDFFKKGKQEEIKLFLDLRNEVLTRYIDQTLA